MIRSIHVCGELKVDDLIAAGYTVKIDYDMDIRHSQHSCLGCIMKDGRSLPFFDMDDENKCITEIGLVGHEWEHLLGEIFDLYEFSYTCEKDDAVEFQKGMNAYRKACGRGLFTADTVKTLVESGTIWLVIGSLISADTVYDAATARKSLNCLVDIKNGAEELGDDVEIRDELIGKLSESIDLIGREWKEYSGNNGRSLF